MDIISDLIAYKERHHRRNVQDCREGSRVEFILEERYHAMGKT